MQSNILRQDHQMVLTQMSAINRVPQRNSLQTKVDSGLARASDLSSIVSPSNH